MVLRAAVQRVSRLGPSGQDPRETEEPDFPRPAAQAFRRPITDSMGSVQTAGQPVCATRPRAFAEDGEDTMIGTGKQTATIVAQQKLRMRFMVTFISSGVFGGGARDGDGGQVWRSRSFVVRIEDN